MITAKAVKAITALGLSEEQVLRDIPEDLLLALSDVSPNDYNPKTCSDDRIIAICHSLQQTGWVPSEMPLVWENPDGATRYTIINGEHRWLICKEAGFQRYPAVVATAVASVEDAMALTMALEEARARRDHEKYTENLIRLAQSNRDELLKKVLRQRDPGELRRLAAQRAEKAQEAMAAVREQRTGPRIVSLTFTQKQFDEYQAAMGKARTRIRQAQATIGILEELSNGDIVAIAALVHNGPPN